MAALPTPGDPESARARRRALLAWYRRHRRLLPWRATRDPYAIWISEAMLQQTRVEAAEPYWRRFLAALPDLEALAAASEERVLELWSGLGYYRRARALHAAARVIVHEHGGSFPRERAAARALPGVGPYTAGAVLSIAYDRPEPVVDGNVARVLSRWYALEGDATTSAAMRRLWALAEELVPQRGGAGDWNQALMELGATLCRPREPRCARCPVSSRCRAFLGGLTGSIPAPRARPQPVDVALELAWVLRRGRVLVVQRPPGGRMAGLWELPTRELAADGPPRLHPREWPLGLELEPSGELGRLRHSITRHRIQARVVSGGIQGAPKGLRWVPQGQLGELALTGLSRKALRASFLTAPSRER